MCYFDARHSPSRMTACTASKSRTTFTLSRATRSSNARNRNASDIARSLSTPPSRHRTHRCTDDSLTPTSAATANARRLTRIRVPQPHYNACPINQPATTLSCKHPNSHGTSYASQVQRPPHRHERSPTRRCLRTRQTRIPQHHRRPTHERMARLVFRGC